MNIKIVSGGQTGVDQGALEAAVQLGLEFGGWAPARWLAEKPLGAIPEVYRSAMREYADLGSNAANYRERTKANVRDSHATLILVEKFPIEGGTKLTRDFAASIGRSHHVVDMSAAEREEVRRERDLRGGGRGDCRRMKSPRMSAAIFAILFAFT